MRSLVRTPEMKRGQIDVWFACVDRPLPEIREFASMLSEEETARARRFRTAQDRDRYIVQHGMLRALLAGYLACQPCEVKIRSGVNGKPCLEGEEHERPLQFSVSHSGAHAAFAFGRCGSIGVDIEEVREIPEMEGIVAYHFTGREKASLPEGPMESRVKVFYRVWTRKEAVLKAQGIGLLKGLQRVDVAGSGGPEPLIMEVAGDSGAVAYSIIDIDGPVGFAAAVAVAGPVPEIVIQSHGI